MKSVLGRGISVFGESSCFLFAHELSCHMKLLFCMYAGIHRKQFSMEFSASAYLLSVTKNNTIFCGCHYTCGIKFITI